MRTLVYKRRLIEELQRLVIKGFEYIWFLFSLINNKIIDMQNLPFKYLGLTLTQYPVDLGFEILDGHQKTI